MPGPSVRVLAFAGARDIVGAPEIDLTLETPIARASDVLDAVCARFPKLSQYRPHLRMAVNGSYVDGDAPVGDGDEVALIPPVAGG
jgi:molybdopterin converting factor subunit 1